MPNSNEDNKIDGAQGNSPIHASHQKGKKPLDKQRINTAIFFTLLFWLLVYFLVMKKKLIVKELTPVLVGALILINLVIIFSSGFLQPVFAGILKVTRKIGNLIFALISAVVYLGILTPIALFKRMTGKPLLQVKPETDRESYYEEWEPAPNLEKQY